MQLLRRHAGPDRRELLPGPPAPPEAQVLVQPVANVVAVEQHSHAATSCLQVNWHKIAWQNMAPHLLAASMPQHGITSIPTTAYQCVFQRASHRRLAAAAQACSCAAMAAQIGVSLYPCSVNRIMLHMNPLACKVQVATCQHSTDWQLLAIRQLPHSPVNHSTTPFCPSSCSFVSLGTMPSWNLMFVAWRAVRTRRRSARKQAGGSGRAQLDHRLAPYWAPNRAFTACCTLHRPVPAHQTRLSHVISVVRVVGRCAGCLLRHCAACKRLHGQQGTERCLPQPAKRGAQHCSDSKARRIDQQLAGCHTNCACAALRWTMVRDGGVADLRSMGTHAARALLKESLCWSILSNDSPSRRRNSLPPQQCCLPQTSAMFFACGRPAAVAAPSATQSCRASVVPRWQARWARSSGGAAAGAATRSAARRLPLAVVARRGGEERLSLRSTVSRWPLLTACENKLLCSTKQVHQAHRAAAGAAPTCRCRSWPRSMRCPRWACWWPPHLWGPLWEAW